MNLTGSSCSTEDLCVGCTPWTKDWWHGHTESNRVAAEPEYGESGRISVGSIINFLLRHVVRSSRRRRELSASNASHPIEGSRVLPPEMELWAWRRRPSKQQKKNHSCSSISRICKAWQGSRHPYLPIVQKDNLFSNFSFRLAPGKGHQNSAATFIRYLVRIRSTTTAQLSSARCLLHVSSIQPVRRDFPCKHSDPVAPITLQPFSPSGKLFSQLSEARKEWLLFPKGRITLEDCKGLGATPL